MSMRRVLFAVALASAVVLPACSKDEGSETADCTPLEQAADGTTAMTVVAKNLAFDVSCVKVKPGVLSITYENEDQGTAHNLHVTGHGVNASTDLEPGVTTQDLEVVLTEPGTYTFACDPHGSMVGKIEVAGAAS